MRSMPDSAPESVQPSRPLLAIDTSSAQGAVALYDGLALSFRSWAAERSHTTTLLTEIHHLFDAASVAVGELGAIAIATGPGAFTGLRAGFGVAKGFHLATGAPLIGISTLEATALPYATCGGAIIATVGAGRGRLVWAHFVATTGSVTETRGPRNGTAEELAAEIAGSRQTIVAGEIDDDQARVLAAVDATVLPSRAFRARQPGAFAELAWRRYLSARFDDAVSLEPVYLSR
jgi:tRNA threonylcarbamoyladenosine biosynthesis protein TsaB